LLGTGECPPCAAECARAPRLLRLRPGHSVRGRGQCAQPVAREQAEALLLAAKDAERAILCDNSRMRDESSDQARRDRARLRGAVPGEVVRNGAAKPNLYAALSLVERFAQMSALCRAQWEASGRVIIDLPRSEWPGELFRIERE